MKSIALKTSAALGALSLAALGFAGVSYAQDATGANLSYHVEKTGTGEHVTTAGQINSVAQCNNTGVPQPDRLAISGHWEFIPDDPNWDYAVDGVAFTPYKDRVNNPDDDPFNYQDAWHVSGVAHTAGTLKVWVSCIRQ